MKNIPRPILELMGHLQHGDMVNAERILQRGDLRLIKFAKPLFDAALQHSGPDPFNILWRHFRMGISSNVDLQFYIVQAASHHQHSDAFQKLYSLLRLKIPMDMHQNFATRSLANMNSAILKECWPYLDFRAPEHNWQKVFDHPKFSPMMHDLLLNTPHVDELAVGLIKVSYRLQRLDVLEWIVSHKNSMRVFTEVLKHKDHNLIQLMCEQLTDATLEKYHANLNQAYYSYVLDDSARNTVEMIMLERTRQRLCAAVEPYTSDQSPQRKSKM